MITIVYLLAVYGFSWVIIKHEDFEWLRTLVESMSTINSLLFKIVSKLFDCILCFSFWTGLFLGIFLFGRYAPLYAFACYGFTLIAEGISISRYER